MDQLIQGEKETPFADTLNVQKTKDIADIYTQLLTIIGEDTTRKDLLKTPLRAAKALQFLTQGYHLDVQTVVNDALFSCDNNEMVIVKDIELFSICEHHLLPIIGKCHIGYLPNRQVLGLSKIARIVDIYAKRLQIQERLTQQIARTLMDVTNAFGVGVIVDAEHLCMKARGVEKKLALVKTCSFLGSFQCDTIQNQFHHLINPREQT